MDHNEKHQTEHPAQYRQENVNKKLVISLRDISHTMRALYEGRGSQRRVLIVLSEAGTITQRELTARLGIQSGSASEVIAKLEGAGLVERTASESDRRTADISLTEEGRRQARAALEQRQRRHEEMFSALTGGEKEQLLSLLEKVNSDWQERYGEQKERPDGRRRGGDFESHADHGGRGRHRRGWAGGWPGHDREEPRRCDHDCANCSHPCGQNRRA